MFCKNKTKIPGKLTIAQQHTQSVAFNLNKFFFSVLCSFRLTQTMSTSNKFRIKKNTSNTNKTTLAFDLKTGKHISSRRISNARIFNMCRWLFFFYVYWKKEVGKQSGWFFVGGREWLGGLRTWDYYRCIYVMTVGFSVYCRDINYFRHFSGCINV